ncbi:MAG: helix-turn-helix domain-containing protein [Clostridia bacterium]|nr:helix-turn-helix domain-containing protein [Clostridia bacterium]
MDLSELYSNTFLKVSKYKGTLPKSTTASDKAVKSKDKSINEYGQTEVKIIRQKQKILSKYEVQEVIKLYINGISANSIASTFGCHRRTISDILKRNGIEVSHNASAKPELDKRVIELYGTESPRPPVPCGTA